MSETKNFLTSDFIPCKNAELRWVFIDQPGKKGPNENSAYRLVASLYATKEDAQPLVDMVEEYWADNKPKGAKKFKSLGFKPEFKLKEGGNPENEDDYEPTGMVAFNFWTGTHWPAKDGKEPDERKIDIYNAKGKKVSLGGKKIGNGSLGAISGACGIYDNGPGSQGVTLYLNAIQLTKFVEFTQDAGFAVQEDDEDGWTGEDDDEFAGTVKSAEESTAEARPTL